MAETLARADEMDTGHPFVDLAVDNEKTLREMDDTIADLGRWQLEREEQQRQLREQETLRDVEVVGETAPSTTSGGSSAASADDADAAEEELRMMQTIERVRQRQIDLEKLQMKGRTSAGDEQRRTGATPSNAALQHMRLQSGGFSSGLDDDLEALEALRGAAAAGDAAAAAALPDGDAVSAGQIQAELEDFDGELADALRRLNIPDTAPVAEEDDDDHDSCSPRI